MSTTSNTPGEPSPSLGGTLWIWPDLSSIPLSGGLKPDSPPPSPPSPPSPSSQRSIMLATFAKYGCGKKKKKLKPPKSRIQRIKEGTSKPENLPRISGTAPSEFPSIGSSQIQPWVVGWQ